MGMSMVGVGVALERHEDEDGRADGFSLRVVRLIARVRLI